MKIQYTNHALKKFNDLAQLGIKLTKRKIREVLKKPIDIDELRDFPNNIATGILDDKHVLRIVYKKENDIIIIITFYPGRKERYI